jgi:Ca2+-transporting ATPase
MNPYYDKEKDSIDSYTSSLELPELANTRDSESIDMLMVPHLDPSNPFAFSSQQLCQVVDQKNLDFIEKVNGIEGISKGLHSNINNGLVWNEDNLSYIRMYDLIHPKKEEELTDVISQFPLSMDCDTFAQRRQVFGSNILPQIEEVSLLQLMWQSFQDKTLVKMHEYTSIQ